MASPLIKRGIIQAFDSATWTATVQVLPSQGNYLTSVQVAKDLAAAEIVTGDECALLFFDELNPADAVLIAVYSVPSAAPPAPSGGGGQPWNPTQYAETLTNVAITDSLAHNLQSIIYTPANRQTLFLWYVEVVTANGNEGWSIWVEEDGAVIPRASGVSDGVHFGSASGVNVCYVFSASFWRTPSAASHTYTLRIARQFVGGNYTINVSQFAIF